ncbi:ShlB/FhaC/HecB family hemolysin secretion/activation protein [Alteromonas sp. a30]|uniref:ShlB/FhaC/HecB family hemolysin secretion/activation protein n=1 Tax=Alteromonas sp. a30 TaxID=2730917 RepID=UPI00227EFDDB|nr:ShlB/FhaC/HecB family hemolysin secretion/activation protein [Alteromonas sp. a30]MCY7294602.1 ShlB/FhaC/HecB family hemolysin secretion/activation protein [Alteromonas sp. a30]
MNFKYLFASCVAACLSFFTVSFFAFAQENTTTVVPSQISQNHERLIKEGNDRIQSELSPLMQRSDVFLQDNFSQQTQQTTPQGDERCFDITRIHVEGVVIFSPEQIRSITHKYTNRCLTLTHINNAVAEISNLYLDNGYVTSRAYIVEQDLSDGTLDLVILEGVIEAFASQENSLSETQLHLAFPVSPTEKLNIRDLEQGLENLNSLGQNKATLAMQPGEQQGGTIVGIQNQMQANWRGSMGINNTGVASTGEYQADANLIYENLFGVNDSLIATVSSNVGEHELPISKSRSYSLVASMPLGYWQFALSNSYFEYEQSVIGTEVNFLTHGTSFNSTLSANHIWYRDQAEKLQVSLAFTRKESRNYIEDVFLETSSRTLYVWDAAATYIHHYPAGSLDATFHVNKSVPWWDAKRELAVAEDDFQFTKYIADVGFTSTFSLLTHPIQMRNSLHLLYAPQEILISEGVNVGGRYSVRGFSQGGLAGFRGGYLRTDFHTGLPWQLPLGMNAQVHLGLDLGASNAPNFAARQHSDWVAGAIIGLQLYYQTLSFNFSYARALHSPDYLGAQEQEIDFSLRLGF